MKRAKSLLLGIILALVLVNSVSASTIQVITDWNEGGNNSQVITTYSPNSIVTTASLTPVYQYYSSFMKDHFWTVSLDEKTVLDASYKIGTSTYEYKGVAGYAYNLEVVGSVPVYRFWNKKTLDHFYTTSLEEKKKVQEDYKKGKDDYEYEGIAWYCPSTSSKPVYRFFDVQAFNHYYTSDVNIANTLIQMYTNGTGTYRYVGVAWYWG